MSVGKHVGTNGNRNVVSRSAGGCKKQFYQMGPPSRTPTISSTPPNVPGAALTRWAARRRLGCRHGTIGGSSCESLHTNLEHFLILDVMLSKNCCTLVFGWSTRVARIDSDCCTPQKPTSSNPSRLEVKNPLRAIRVPRAIRVDPKSANQPKSLCGVSVPGRQISSSAGTGTTRALPMWVSKLVPVLSTGLTLLLQHKDFHCMFGITLRHNFDITQL